MVFSSHIFLYYFLPLALLVYYLTPKGQARHLLLAAVSYVFYGWWNPWFTLLMFGTTVVDFICGKFATPDRTPRTRKIALLTSIFSNLGMLGFFKYAGFFQANANVGLDFFGFDPMPIFQVALPVGISFYTFQSLSYTLDIYRGQTKPAESLIDFVAFVSLFPQLVAGPIVRYSDVMDQMRGRTHTLEKFSRGSARFMLGFSKKILLANPMGTVADLCFATGDGSLGMLTAWLGVIAYAFQIYFDFSAYSDMAIGLGEMMGFEFPKNFDSPYRATSITDFWRRWHITLSTFLRDYVYIPLGGNRMGLGRTYANLFLTMLIGGFWHGAQWTFIIWGAFHGGLLALERLRTRHSLYNKFPTFVKIALTFALVLIGWVFFRAENFSTAARYLGAMFGLASPQYSADLLLGQILRPWTLFNFILCAIVVWMMPQTASFVHRLTTVRSLGIVLAFILSVAAMAAQGFNPFLYFQF